MGRRGWLGGWLWLVCFIASAQQDKVPARRAGSFVAPEVWRRLALAQLWVREVNAAALSPDGSVLIVGIRDGVFSRLVGYEVHSSRMLWDHGMDDAADLFTISEDGSQFAARTGFRCGGMALKHWSLRTGEELAPLAQDGSFAGQVGPSAIAYGGNLIAAAVAMSGDLQLWDARIGKTVKSIEANFKGLIPHQGLAALTLGNGGRNMWAGGFGVVLGWELPGAKKMADIKSFRDLPVTHLIASTDGQELAAGTHAGIEILEVASGKVIQTIAGEWQPAGFVPGGSLVVASRSQFGRWTKGKGIHEVRSLPLGVRKVFVMANGEIVGLDLNHSADVQLVALDTAEQTRRFLLPGR